MAQVPSYMRNLKHPQHPHCLNLIQCQPRKSLVCTCCNGELKGHCDVNIHLNCADDMEEEGNWNGAYEKFMLEYGTKDDHAKMDMITQLLKKLHVTNAGEASASLTSRPPLVTMRVQPIIQRLPSSEKPGLQDAFNDVNLPRKLDAETLERKAKKMAAKEARQKLKANSFEMLENLEKIVLDMQSSKNISQSDAQVLAATYENLKKGKIIMQEEIAVPVQSKMRQGPRVCQVYNWNEGRVVYELLTSLRADMEDVHFMLLCEEPGHEHFVEGSLHIICNGVLGELGLGILQPLLASGLQVLTRALSTLGRQLPQYLDCVTLPNLGNFRWDLRTIDLEKHGERSREPSEDEENVEALKRAEEAGAEWILSDLENRGINIYDSHGLLRDRYIVTEASGCPLYT